MKLWNVPSPDALRIIAEVSGTRYGGNIIPHAESMERGALRPIGRALRFRLSVESSRESGARVAPSGRRVAAACWHAHRDIMRAIFAEFPAARISSTLADYRGREAFERQFPATGGKNIGSTFNPCRFESACDC